MDIPSPHHLTGIVGSGAEKFTPETERHARMVIDRLLQPDDVVLVSGRSPMGGVDVWAEEWADHHHRAKCIFPPPIQRWIGYKSRNIQISDASHDVHVIVPASYPETYRGRTFQTCYHCASRAQRYFETRVEYQPWWWHVKSGACWTAWHAEERGKHVAWHIVTPTGVHTYYGRTGRTRE